jgi:hypothetical protein
VVGRAQLFADRGRWLTDHRHRCPGRHSWRESRHAAAPVEQPPPRQPDAPVEMLSAPANAVHERARQEKEEVSHREVVRAAGDR